MAMKLTWESLVSDLSEDPALFAQAGTVESATVVEDRDTDARGIRLRRDGFQGRRRKGNQQFNGTDLNGRNFDCQ